VKKPVEVIEISDDNDDSTPPPPRKTGKPTYKYVLRASPGNSSSCTISTTESRSRIPMTRPGQPETAVGEKLDLPVHGNLPLSSLRVTKRKWTRSTTFLQMIETAPRSTFLHVFYATIVLSVSTECESIIEMCNRTLPQSKFVTFWTGNI
jgi:hypothetical protein